jgi:penicillin-binding protein 2
VYYLSVYANDKFTSLSKKNSIKYIYNVASRGEIRDTNNKLLALNKPGFNIKIKPHLYNKKNKDELLEAINLIKQIPTLKNKNILKTYLSRDSLYKHEYVKVIHYVEPKEMLMVFQKLSLNSNIQLDASVKRLYPYKEVAGHILGYASKTTTQNIAQNNDAKYHHIQGKTGIEKYYNSKLSGELGYKKVVVDSTYREIKIFESKEPTSQDLQLTIDIRLQEYLNKLFKGLSGVGIVMNAQNGEILVAGSYPEFDNNIFARGISNKEWDKIINDLEHPFTNKITHGLYPPGSIIKMGTAIAFLRDKVSPYRSKHCTGSIKVGKRNFRCWATWGHGKVNMKRAIRESCDQYFYEYSLEVGINKVANTLAKFGLGKQTGVDLPNEFIGVNPDKAWKRAKYSLPWYMGETLNSVIGQGHMLVTPMQIAKYTAAIATSKLVRPHFLKTKEAQNITNINISKKYLKRMRVAMREVVTHKKGTMHKYINTTIKVAAKTGTAQVISIAQDQKVRMKESEQKYFSRSHAWVTSFAPYKKPKYVIVILVEHGGHGGSATGKILELMYKKLKKYKYL